MYFFVGEAETGSLIGSEEKAKSVSFEDEEPDRCPLGAKERWLWAFRKINVSRSLINVYKFERFI